jgi:hypothetical protein
MKKRRTMKKRRKRKKRKNYFDSVLSQASSS